MTTTKDIMTNEFVDFLLEAECTEYDLWNLSPEQMEFAANLDERQPQVREILYGKA